LACTLFCSGSIFAASERSTSAFCSSPFFNSISARTTRASRFVGSSWMALSYAASAFFSSPARPCIAASSAWK
jgi:hypothetical protein